MSDFVTGIVPNHNHADYVLLAMTSLAEEGVNRIVLVDDGSIDGSLTKVFQHFGLERQLRPRMEASLLTIHCYHEVPVWIMSNPPTFPMGPAYSRNRAIKEAWDDTDVFALLDADDEYLPGALGKLLAELVVNQEPLTLQRQWLRSL